MVNLFRKVESPVGAQFSPAAKFEMALTPLTEQDSKAAVQKAQDEAPGAQFPRTTTQQFLANGLFGSTLLGYGLVGTSRQLKKAAQQLLKDPTSEKAGAAFADALDARCKKVWKLTGKDIHVYTRDVEAVKTILTRYASKDQKASLENVQKAALSSLAKGLTSNAVKKILEGDVASIESKIKAHSQALSELSGESAESFEKAIRAGVFQALAKGLQEVATVTPEMVKSRIAAETATYKELVKQCEKFDADDVQFQVRYTQQMPKAEAAVETAEKARSESGVQLRGELAALRNVLATLIERAAVVGVDATSQQEVLRSLTALLDTDVEGTLAHQTVRELAPQLTALSKFLDHKDTKKLSSAEKKPVVASLKVIQGSIDSFFKADLALFTARGVVEALKAEDTQAEKTRGELIGKRDAQAALVTAQANLEVAAENMAAYESQVVAYNKQFGFFGRGLVEPVFPESAEVKEGIETLVQVEVAAANTLNKAVFNYLKPEVAPAPRGFFGRIVDTLSPVKF